MVREAVDEQLRVLLVHDDQALDERDGVLERVLRRPLLLRIDDLEADVLRHVLLQGLRGVLQAVRDTRQQVVDAAHVCQATVSE